MTLCDMRDDRNAVHRIRWTVYGGAFKYAYVCERHWSQVRGQRGVDVYVGNTQDNVRGWTGSDRVER
jgi:hypothetical protein